MTSKAFAATYFATQNYLDYANLSTKELLLCIVLSFIIFALPGEIKEQIRKHNERKLKKEEAAQANQSTEPEETTDDVNSNEIRETKENDENENS